MFEKRPEQLEIFSSGSGSGEPVNRGERSAFLKRIWGFEKFILILMALLAVAVVSFSFGIEKGKKMAAASAPTVTVDNPPAKPLPDKKETEQKKKDLLSGYTIQVASYTKKSSAQKEAELLKKKGYTSLLIPKGSYTLVCVGNFSSKDKAKISLQVLRRVYRDCYIRRL